MGNEGLMKDIYQHFGKKKDEGQEIDSIANIFYELGNEDKGEIKIEKPQNGQ